MRKRHRRTAKEPPCFFCGMRPYTEASFNYNWRHGRPYIADKTRAQLTRRYLESGPFPLFIGDDGTVVGILKWGEGSRTTTADVIWWETANALSRGKRPENRNPVWRFIWGPYIIGAFPADHPLAIKFQKERMALLLKGEL